MTRKKQVIAHNEIELPFWTEPVRIGDRRYDLTVVTTGQGLCWLSLGEGDKEEATLQKWSERWLPGYRLVRKKEPNTQVLQEMTEYLTGKRNWFNVLLHQLGTPFQIKVWQELGQIPYGKTCSYRDIAARIGCPKGARAVGMANHHNPIAVIVPCHRVIGRDGDLTGYGGGLELKKELLSLEKS